MSSQNKSGGKPGQRSRKTAQQRGQKPAPLQSPEPEPLQAQKPEPLPNQPGEPLPNGNKQIDAAVASTDAFPIGAVASANPLAIDLQTIATAYGDYGKKSFEQTKAFVEKLSGVRSLDKAIEIQTEFARQAYETFVTESQKICELYSGLARQSFRPFEGLVARMIPAAR